MSKALPCVSVIIPVYNAERTLEACVESIYAQTYSCIEVICVDDGSLDASRSIIGVLQEKHPDVRVLSQKHAGAPRARNTGAHAAKGTFLFFCDADVLLAPDAISRLCDALAQHADATFAYGDYVFHDGTVMRSPHDYRAVEDRPCISTMSLIRRDCFPGFDETLHRFQDWDLWLTVVHAGGRGVKVRGQPLFSTLTQGGISRRVSQIWFWWPLSVLARICHPGMRAYVQAAVVVRRKHHVI